MDWQLRRRQKSPAPDTIIDDLARIVSLQHLHARSRSFKLNPANID
jgi:hypothetical protein